MLAVSTQSLSTPQPLIDPTVPGHLLGTSFGFPGDRTFDYIIVGGGTAGLVVAARLAEDGSNSVAVVEAGSFYEIGNGNLSQIPADGVWFAGKALSDTNPLIDWDFHTTPQAVSQGCHVYLRYLGISRSLLMPYQGFLNQSSHYARGKCLGGSSARNYMAYQRGTVESYDQWADQVGDQSYQFDQFLPYFQKSVNFTPPDESSRPANATPDYDVQSIGSSNGLLSVTFSHYAQAFSSWAQKALTEIGIPPIQGFTSGSLNGSSYQLLTIDAGRQTRASSETAFLRPSLTKPNLIVYQSTLAKQIFFDGSKTATGVQISIGGSLYTLSARKEVIVSAGTFQSPQLLMVSGVGPAGRLQRYNIPVVADRPGVGQNMWVSFEDECVVLLTRAIC